MESVITVELFRENLFNTINSSNLTVGAAFYVFKDVYNEFEKIYNAQLEKEKEELKNSNNKTTLMTEKGSMIEIETEEEIKEEE